MQTHVTWKISKSTDNWIHHSAVIQHRHAPGRGQYRHTLSRSVSHELWSSLHLPEGRKKHCKCCGLSLCSESCYFVLCMTVVSLQCFIVCVNNIYNISFSFYLFQLPLRWCFSYDNINVPWVIYIIFSKKEKMDICILKHIQYRKCSFTAVLFQ